jgi:hypothetical protein
VTKSAPVGTLHLGVGPATNVLHAVRFAASRGRPLSTAVTINWDRLGLADPDATAAFRKLRSKVKAHWKYLRVFKGIVLESFDDVVSHENPEGHRNTHWLIHVPAFFAPQFKKAVARFLAKVVGINELGRALHFTAVGGPGGFAKYMLKGVDPSYGDYFCIDPIEQGFISGRGRTSVSRVLSQAARKRDGWVRKRRPKPGNGSIGSFS